MHLKIAEIAPFNSPLFRYADNVMSQCGEDGIIAQIIKLITPQHQYCVEFGAWDGKFASNCYNLLRSHGWSGLMIEANTEKFQELSETYAGAQNVALANRFVELEGDNKLDNILREYGAPISPGLISIDIDGNDYYVWESLTDHRPEIVVIEMNPTVPNDVVFIQEKSFDVNQGCSLAALVLLGKEKGYELAACTMFNALFVRADKFPLLGLKHNSIHNLYMPLQNGRIFQGYDGTIHVIGFDKMIWHHGRSVSSADFQVLPEAERRFADALTRNEWINRMLKEGGPAPES
jgi:hypothetical protein